ncbi:hypothetical protein DYB37_007097 [Aphanomyces astaci]|uniref:GH16 domain-containing protein n=1 Tax=Aphanomyces astaci TaxID=112090 RepID=A0A3R6XNT4_APHAT|nr:hypothetical protein DYB37_007097 [Aphanomyces astaci]
MRVVAAAAATVTSMVTALAVKEEYLIFEEDFDSTFDLSVWKHDITLGGNGNREFEVYVNSRNNSYVKDGKLHLRATLTDEAYGRESIENGVMDLWGRVFLARTPSCSSPQFAGCRKEANGHDILPPVQSARIQTMESFSFKYGRVEVRTKLPRGDWLWPGIWMMAKDNRYGPWPSSGELDIMESRGTSVHVSVCIMCLRIGNGPDYTDDKGNPIGNNRFSACFHFGPAWNKDGYPVAVNDTQALPDHRSYGDEFHTFGFYWDEDDMYAYVDSPENVVTRVAEYGKKSFWDIGLESGAWNASDSFNNFQEGPINAPFDQEMYLIMNVAVGGTSIAKGFLDSGYFPDDQGDKPWHTNDSYPAANFYHQKDKWFPSWTTNEDGTNTATGRASDFSAMQVDSVKVWGIRGLTTFTNSKNAVHRYDDTTTATTTIDCSTTCPYANTVPTCLDRSTASCFATSSACFAGTTPCNLPTERLVFSDSFDKLDLSKWQHEITMTGHRTSFMHMSTADQANSYVANGHLVLAPTLSAPVVGFLDNSTVDLWGTSPATLCTSNFNHGCLQTGTGASILPPIRSATLRTEKSFSFRYGRVEVRAKVPTGKWLRPVFRLLPKYDSYGEWPQSGEVVLFEGREDGQAVESRVHYGPFNMSTGSEPQLTRFNRMNNQTNESDDGFHLYGLYWDENELYMYVDSRDNIVSRVHGYGTSSLWQSQWGDVNDTSPYRQQRLQAPFDQQFYLSVGLRVGGTDGFFPDHVDGKPWNDTSSRHKETFDKALPEWGPTWSTKPDASWFEIDQVSVWATSAASSWTYHGSFGQAGEVDGDKLLFSDSFATLDMRHWKPEITMNTGGEFQMYVNHRQVGFVRNKTLVLRPALSADIIGNASLFEGYMDMWGTDVPSKCTAAAASGCGHVSSATDMAPPIHSASFRTAESFAFQYGHVQISATMPHGAAYLIPRLRLVPLTRDQGWLDIAVAKTEITTSSQTVVATGFCTNSTACDIAYHEIIPRSTHVYGVIWNATDTLMGVGGVSTLPHYSFEHKSPPWNASAPYPHTQFYHAKNQWWPSWADPTHDDGYDI